MVIIIKNCDAIVNNIKINLKYKCKTCLIGINSLNPQSMKFNKSFIIGDDHGLQHGQKSLIQIHQDSARYSGSVIVIDAAE